MCTKLLTREVFFSTLGNVGNDILMRKFHIKTFPGPFPRPPGKLAPNGYQGMTNILACSLHEIPPATLEYCLELWLNPV